MDNEFKDHWPDAGGRSTHEFEMPWTGTTVFNIMPKKPRKGYEIVQGEEVRTQKTGRPYDMLPAEYRELQNKKDVAKVAEAISAGEREKEQRTISREHVGVQGFIPPVRQQEFDRTLEEAASMYKIPAAPAPASPLGGGRFGSRFRVVWT